VWPLCGEAELGCRRKELAPLAELVLKGVGFAIGATCVVPVWRDLAGLSEVAASLANAAAQRLDASTTR